MGRKSLAVERTEQILDAFEACIIEHGLDGATLQRVADRAGMKLSMIDHYIGKRDALVNGMVERFIGTYQRDNVAFLATLSAENRLDQLLNFYFSEAAAQYRPHDTIILTELMTLAERDVYVKGVLLGLYHLLEQSFYDELRRNYPSATEEQCQRTAYLILSLWYGHVTLQWLGFGKERHRWALESAEMLVIGLQKDVD